MTFPSRIGKTLAAIVVSMRRNEMKLAHDACNGEGQELAAELNVRLAGLSVAKPETLAEVVKPRVRVKAISRPSKAA